MSGHESDDARWRATLSPEQYAVCRCSATEPPFTGNYWNHKADGVYRCVACGEALFDSTSKYDSGSGWPSFFQAVDEGNIELHEDHSHGAQRTEVICANCGSHLGHVFNDAPQTPTGERYCINSCALNLEPDE